MSRGNVLTLLLTVLGAFAALCALLYLLQERLIFLPRQLSEGTRSALRELPGVTEIEVRAGDGTRPPRLAPARGRRGRPIGPRHLLRRQRGGGVRPGLRGGRPRPVVIGGLQLPRLRAQRGAAERDRPHRGRPPRLRPAWPHARTSIRIASSSSDGASGAGSRFRLPRRARCSASSSSPPSTACGASAGGTTPSFRCHGCSGIHSTRLRGLRPSRRPFW